MDELERRAEEAPPEHEAPPGDPGAGQAEEAPEEAPATPVADDDDMGDGDGGDAMMRLEPAAVAELYSPPRVTATLPRLGLVAGPTFDLHADEAGVAWDFTRTQDRKRAWERIRAEEPDRVVGSPPCTMVSLALLQT